MNVPIHIHFVFVTDLIVLVAKRLSIRAFQGLNALVAGIFVCVDHTAGNHVLFNDRSKLVGSHACNDFCYNLAAALNEANNGNLSLIAAHRSANPVLALTTEIGFVNLYRRSLQLQITLRQERANLLEHAPSSLVGNSSLALNLLCGDAATCRTHEIHRVEPSAE